MVVDCQPSVGNAEKARPRDRCDRSRSGPRGDRIDCKPATILSSHRQSATVAKTGQRQAITPADPGLLEDMLQVDLDGAWLDAEVHCDLLVLIALFDQLKYLLLADG